MLASSFPLHSTWLDGRARGLAALLAGVVYLITPNAQAKDERYDLRISGQTVQVGKTQSIKIQLTADQPWHMNIDYPTSLKLQDAAGIKLGKTKFKKGDAKTLSEHKIVFMVPVTASKAGTQVVDGKLRFAICKEDACSPASAKVKLRINAKSKPKAATARKTPRRASAKPQKAQPPEAMRYVQDWLWHPTWGPGLSPIFFGVPVAPGQSR